MVVIGSCQTFCPAQEVRERTKHRQLHPVFEKDVPIKRYSRPAAGKNADLPETVRPPEVLLRVTTHLIDVTLRQADFATCYPFVWDRLWAVRQDLTLQQTTCRTTRAVLARCARFYVAAATLCVAEQAPLSVFDPAINASHFMDTTGRLLHLYEDNDIVSEDRPEIESLYLLWNVDSFAVFARAVTLHPDIKQQMGRTPFDIATASLHDNWYRLLRTARQFHSTLWWSALAPKLDMIRIELLAVLNTTYSSKVCVFPLHVLARWLDMSEEDCGRLLTYCNIPVTMTEDSAGGDNERRPLRNVNFLKSRDDLNLSTRGLKQPYFIDKQRVGELRTKIGVFVLGAFM